MEGRLRGAALLAGLVLALGIAGAAWGEPPHEQSPKKPRSQKAVGDGVVDTPLEYDRKFKADHEHGGTQGHLPPSSRNVELVGKLRVSDAAPDRIADVASLGDFAYLAAYFRPACRNGGVYVIDISNPRAPTEAGFIPTSPGSYVGEGVQVLHLDTAQFRGDLLVHNNEPCASSAPGGMSLWDVTNPRSPRPLARHAGDPGVAQPANAIHSVFAWQQGERAFAVQVDDYETGDVDIFEITDPTKPVQIAEVGVNDWPEARNAFESQSWGLGAFPDSFHHDVQVRNVDGNWRMLLSYWDAGYIVLDVNDPASPRFIADSDFPDPDPRTGVGPPEGNAHYAEWDRTGKLVLAADEDFSPEAPHGKITTGAFAGRPFDPRPVGDTRQVERDDPLVGPTYFAGRACTPAEIPRAPSADAIAVIERGGEASCTFQAKVTNVEGAGYQGGIIFNRALVGGEDPANSSSVGPCEVSFHPSPAASNRPFLFVTRSAGFKILGIPGYDASDCGTSEPGLPSPGAQGQRVEVRKVFDGWGYMRLLDANTLDEIDSYAIPEAVEEHHARGSGDLTIHETAADPTHDVAYLSWYNAGFRVAAFDGGDLREVGHYIDIGGNDFWGVQVHVTPDCERLVLASDRDYGLYIFRYLGVPSQAPCPPPRPSVSPPPSGVPAPVPAYRVPPRALGRCHNPIRGTNRRNRLRGTPGSDRIDALRGDDRARGLGGDDCLYGRQGSDKLLGGHGNDRLSGSTGRDRLSGSTGNDRLYGGAGNDRLSGGRGSNRYSAGSDDDYIDAANGRRERVSCGKGRDRVRADRTDRVRRCERIFRVRKARG